jgi:hypothetical protein
MKKLIVITFLLVLQFFGTIEPSFAAFENGNSQSLILSQLYPQLRVSMAPLPRGMLSSNDRPGYTAQTDYIVKNSCKAIAMVPYSGSVFYSCPNGQKFWSEVIVPTEDSPLFMYFKNRKKVNGEDADDAAIAASATINSY